MADEHAAYVSVSKTTHSDRLYHTIHPLVTKDLRRFRVVYIEDVYTTMIASADNYAPILREFNHFNISTAIRDFERSRGGEFVDGIQIVSGGHVIDDDLFRLETDV